MVRVAVWDEVACDEQSHTGVMVRWTRRRYDRVLCTEVGCQSWITDLLESDDIYGQAETATEDIGELAKESQADVE